ncbi:MAG: hypothetical protein ABWY56_04170 [Propionibacteriaceae bacterium]
MPSYEISTVRSSRREAWLVAVSSVVILLLACVAIGLRATVSARDRADNDQLDGPQAHVVLAYLRALAAADADTALELSATRPADTRLLSSQVMAESQSRLPLSDFVVTSVAVHGARGVVDVSYRMGQLGVSTVLPVVQVGDTWRLERGYAVVDLSPAGPVPVRIDGHRVGTRIVLFPGSHRIVTGLRWLSFGENAQWLVTSPDDVGPLATPLQVILTPSGRAAFLTAVEQAIARCTSVRATAPPGCPFSVAVERSLRVRSSSIGWQLERHTFGQLEPQMLPGRQTHVARAGAVLGFRFSAEATEQGRTKKVVLTVRRYVTVNVDMLERPLRVELL